GHKWRSFGPVAGGFNNAYPFVYNDGSGSRLYVIHEFNYSGEVRFVGLKRWNGSTWDDLGQLGSYDDISVSAVPVFEDGGGPAIFSGGHFSTIAGVSAPGIARWRAGSWSGVGGGTDDDVHALEVYNDGSGSALYAAGSFTHAGGAPAQKIAKWNGS